MTFKENDIHRTLKVNVLKETFSLKFLTDAVGTVGDSKPK